MLKKTLKYVSLLLIVVMTVFCSLSVMADNVEIDENSIAGKEANPDIEVSGKVSGGKVNFSIKNGSEESIKNVYIIADENNKSTAAVNGLKVGEIKAGEKVTRVIGIKNLNKFFKKASYENGGYAILNSKISIALVIILLISLIAYYAIKGITGKKGVSMVVCVGVLIVGSIGALAYAVSGGEWGYVSSVKPYNNLILSTLVIFTIIVIRVVFKLLKSFGVDIVAMMKDEEEVEVEVEEELEETEELKTDLFDKFKDTLVFTIMPLIFISVIEATLCMVTYSGIDMSEYKEMNTGINCYSTVNVNVDGNKNTFYIKYNQDEITYETTEHDEELDYKTKYEYDSSIACTDKPKIKTIGLKGTKHVITTTKYRNGKVDTSSDEETITVEPQSQVVVQGTRTTVEIQNIEANKEYIPDDTMKVGDFKLVTDVQVAKSNVGKKEVTYTWNKSKNEVESSEVVTKEPGTNTWKAGTLVTVEKVLKANTEYVIRKDKPVGWENVVDETIDGVKTTIYKTEIDKKTGEPVKGNELEYYATRLKEPVDGKKEVGVLKEENVTTERDTVYEKDPEKLDNEETVSVEGKDKIEKVTSIMKFDTEKGKVTDEVEKEISKELVQEPEARVIVQGSKEPTWLEEKSATEYVQYNIIYVADDSLKGDESVVEKEGKLGRLVTTRLIAVDENGDRLTSYEPKIIEENALSKPEDEIVHVAPDSKYLNK